MQFGIKTIFLLIAILFFNANIDSKNNTLTPSFKLKTHKQINSQTLKKIINDLNLSFVKDKFELCEVRLTRSQSIQDIFVPSKSKAHFDNCAFQKSINYINRLIAKNDEFAKKYLTALKKKRKQADLDLLRRKILFNIGKILHTIQDFYAHTNYLELMKEQKSLDDIPTIEFWEKIGQDKILDLQKKGLVSGVAWWVFPKKCPKNSRSHAELAKDSIKYDLGKKKTQWTDPNTNKQLNGFEVARYLAEKSTYDFLLHSFNKYPMLKTYCADLSFKETKNN